MTEMQQKARIALVLGATGGIGGAVARGLSKRGWQVRALNRNAEKAAKVEPAFDWRQGDAMNARDVRVAAEGADLIVHAVNPPGYRNWGTLVLPMLDSTIAAAKAVGARVLLPGTIYNFGRDAFPILNEDAPQNPDTDKGLIRKEMERRLKDASETGVGVIIVRAGDFFGPGAANNWFSQGLVKPGKPVTTISYPGREGIAHQWAYLPDVAEIMVRLVERAESLPRFAVYHMRGFLDRNGTEMVAAIRRALGKPGVPVRSFPWWLIGLASPFVPLFRELHRMRYVWREPLRMPNERLLAVLGEEPHTPIDEAVATTLKGLGCMPKEIATRATTAGRMPA
ncbi:SDR family NAD(P)-dependent oxidoreductase [Ensifer adhaerens]|uniref:SDR family NAD(P)-dependent oxidoreductase n=1 Tax=Ensifer adhaerens TaxID=106592 RepID=UPI001CC1B482|nr:SDR family NAD(P)-dependent oxidoreductase [Ensifer adhaerens]MBZ7921728.1 SDR family NAD(P)-dependent oxidoreductase [Ensifer adhaerens]UAX94135.1 SDR family NAD(P)-dependent oxidoreductase [Ensifer adhaerens]UAY01769.1 SDR family NAD(P)-dependent oxidoreductase [Ensifer adhaerens]UAY09153.1 SDR family NAD(P)-dependent oxidoreductase [Ensifer adhaerens]